MPYGKDLDDGLAYDEEGQEEAKNEHDALIPMDNSDRMKRSMRRDSLPSNFMEADSSEEEEDGIMASAPKYVQSDAKEKASLTSFIMQEAQMKASRDPGEAKVLQDLEKTELMLKMLTEGVPLKTVVTKYLVPKSALGDAFSGEQNLEERKAMVSGKTYTVEIFRVLYLLRDQKTIAWRGPVNEQEGFASPFCRTRSMVESYQLSHMYKPMVNTQRRYIRLTFKCPATAKQQYRPRRIDILAKDEDEFSLLAAGFDLLWRYHSYKLKCFERDPKLLMRKSVARPKTLVEKWEQIGYSPLVFQSLDPDNNIKNFYIGLGRSKEDILLIGASQSGFWSLLLMLFGILMKASLESDETNFALWAYFYFLIFFGCVCTLAVVLSKTDVEELGLTSTRYKTDSKGQKTVVEKETAKSQSWQEMCTGWALKLGDWMMFGIFELSIGGPIALAWIVLWDNMAHPLYSFYQNRGFTLAYKAAKAESQRKVKEARIVAKHAHAKGKHYKKHSAALPGQIGAACARLFTSAKAKAKQQTVSKREIRKRQTTNVGVGALHKEERRARRNKGSAIAETDINRRKSRRDSAASFKLVEKGQVPKGRRETSQEAVALTDVGTEEKTMIL
uniref:Uncharacterized protein n=1 Tax=Florenciella parvula TaxID=236787 RepID=A0A6T7E7G4_9STRA|mmetsp:Transcript_23801/g.49243  ORF Transcript_23801/g.49243 Transcript_23801/m.49243 type:complete len:615 (+) Transcript_23801:330-2174(+)